MLKMIITASLLAISVGAAQSQTGYELGQRSEQFYYDSNRVIPEVQRMPSLNDRQEPGNGSPNWRDGAR
jgi:hypothetical protein